MRPPANRLSGSSADTEQLSHGPLACSRDLVEVIRVVGFVRLADEQIVTNRDRRMPPADCDNAFGRRGYIAVADAEANTREPRVYIAASSTRLSASDDRIL
ncbi:hypothetical protein LIA77_11821 [Sarocladium implicatum]|nr:hypothetical protein LIA77_11821 [Sarocladium implicatum]